MNVLNKIKKELNAQSSKEKAQIYKRFFKTAKGQYGEGDIFIGLTVPEQRTVAKKYYNYISLEELKPLINSKIHEYRLTAAIILTFKFEKTKIDKEKIYKFLIKNIKNLNNWDLVDLTVPKIIGNYIYNNKKNINLLYKYAKSKNLWLKRISIISTFYFIKQNEFKDTINISKILLGDSHDLIHKAVGWMLREVAKKDINLIKNFIKEYYDTIPRTTLRYAIERFNEKERLEYLSKVFL